MCAENEWVVAWKCKRKQMEEESKRMEALEDSLAASYKVNIVLLSSPAFMLLCIYWIDLKLYVHTKPCTWILLIAALVRIAKTGSNQDVLQ